MIKPPASSLNSARTSMPLHTQPTCPARLHHPGPAQAALWREKDRYVAAQQAAAAAKETAAEERNAAEKTICEEMKMYQVGVCCCVAVNSGKLLFCRLSWSQATTCCKLHKPHSVRLTDIMHAKSSPE